MALTKIGSSGLSNSAVTSDKITADSITEAKIADAAVENEHLNTNIITGFSELAEVADNGDFLIIYDSSTGTLKKIQRSNITLQVPNITSISPTNVDSKDSATTTTFIVTGTGFDTTATAKLISNGGTEISFNTVTRDSATQLTCVLNNGLITGDGLTDEPYDIKVSNSSGLTSTLANQIYVDQKPVFVTAAGSLGNIADSARTSTTYTIQATDPESAGQVSYELISGSLPTGATLSNVNNDGGVATISGFSAVGSNTTSTFVIGARDADSNFSYREFSITVLAPVSTSFTSSGTFSVPVGVTAVDVLVVGGGGSGGCQHGGGGGAGGLIFRPGFPVTPGGTVSVTVGCGGATTGSPRPSPTWPSYQGQDSVFGTLTAKGGGRGSVGPESGGPSASQPGGSGGGGGYPSTPVGTATQPTQPGDSGTYGFGNPGGLYSTHPSNASGGGGGGAGAAGTGGQNTCAGQPGGIGRAYTIADGTTPVYYSGGGGGGGHGPTGSQGGQGGGGGGGAYVGPNAVAGNFGVAGQANTGGGGGANGRGIAQGSGPLNVIAAGGKGIVIVRY